MFVFYDRAFAARRGSQWRIAQRDHRIHSLSDNEKRTTPLHQRPRIRGPLPDHELYRWLTKLSVLHKLINLFHRSQPCRQSTLHPRRPLRHVLTGEMNSSIARERYRKATESDKRPGAARPFI